MDITKQILEVAGAQCNTNLTEHVDQINSAFSNSEDILEINQKTRLSFVKGKLRISTGINFVTDRFKDKLEQWWDPDQMQLFDEEPNNGDD